MILPQVHDVIALKSMKHDHSLHRFWEKNIILYKDDDVFVGYNDKTNVKEPNKSLWQTNEPAIFYFDRRYWFNIVFILDEQPFYYCNMTSPFTYENGVLQYIDYDLDVIVQLDGSYSVIDEDEYKANCRYYQYSQDVQNNIQKHLAILLEWIQLKQGPFQEEQRHHFYNLYRKSITDK